ncbi:MAG: DUF6175 family protein [Bacteroidales bacterium]|nr:DUF6175 family protein [Bacteroidales bacterium]
MKKIFLLLAAVLFSAGMVWGQAKKPTLMVVPSDNWCKQNGFMLKFDNQGSVEELPDYKKALQGSSDLILVIAKVSQLMADRGFPCKLLEQELKKLSQESAEDAMLTSKSGSGVAESPIDKLYKSAKADIILQITWSVNTTGPKRSVTFVLQGIDAYTGKQIASASGTGAPSFSAELPVLLEEAVLAHIDNFNNQLQAHFDDMFANGREIIVRIKKFDSWPDDFETEFDGKELGQIIEEWFQNNTVKGRFNTTDATANFMLFEQVRIPIYDANGKAVDARSFLRGLQNYLKNPPYNLTSKLMIKGLGQATLVIGEK